jgi:uncharacterized protein (DUF362 family)
MPPISRRDFVRLLAAGTGVLTLEQFLAACGLKPTSQALLPTQADTAIPPTALSPTATASQMADATLTPSEGSPTTTPASINVPDLVVARSGQPEDLVRRAIAALGGMGQFVKSGANVIIKPNICVAYHTYEYAATTNPWVVAALVKLSLEAGAKSVKVMDFPFGGSAEEAYVISGIAEQVQTAGGEMALMPSFKYKKVKLPQALDLKQASVFQEALDADTLINVPIAKHHGLARLTMGMKNLMGLIKDRSSIHRNMGQRLADLSSLFQPDLTVIDAVRILTRNGPTGGNLDDVKQLDTVIASRDIVAADSYGSTLFGLRPEDLVYIPAAVAMGLGRSDLANLKIAEI